MLKFLRFGMWAIISLGLLVVCAGLLLTYNTTQFRKSAASAPGMVVDLVEKVRHSEDGTSVVYAPKVNFRTASGQDVVFLSDTGSSPPGFHVGEPVAVMYQPDRPSEAKLNTFWQLWLGPVICFGIGGVFLMLGIGFFLLVTFLARQQQAKTAIPAGFPPAAYGHR